MWPVSCTGRPIMKVATILWALGLMHVCMNLMRGEIGNDLNTDNGPRGIDSPQVERCSAAIRNEQCDHRSTRLSAWRSAERLRSA